MRPAAALCVLALPLALSACAPLIAALGVAVLVTDDAETLLTGAAQAIHEVKGAIRDRVPVVGGVVDAAVPRKPDVPKP